MLLSEAFNRYIQDRIIFANKSPKTEESYIYTRNSLLTFTGDIPLENLDFTQIRAWVAKMKKRGLVSGTIRGYVVNTRAVLDYMQIMGEDCLRPEMIPVPKRTDPTPSYLTPEQVSRLITLILSTPNSSKLTRLRNASIVSLLYSSAVRASELCSLNREDIQGDTFTVLGKGGKRRPCMVDERTKKLLNEYLALRVDAHPALFLAQGTRLNSSTLQSQFRRISSRYGKPVHAHTLRHSTANNLMRNGCHIYPLSRIMGHSSIATTQTYFQMHDPELLEAHKKYHSV